MNNYTPLVISRNDKNKQLTSHETVPLTDVYRSSQQTYMKKRLQNASSNLLLAHTVLKQISSNYSIESCKHTLENPHVIM